MKGRPTKLTPKVQEAIITAVSQGATYKDAALYARVSLQVFYLWRKKGEELIAKIDEEEGLAVAEDREPDYTITPKEKKLIDFFYAVEEANSEALLIHLQNLNDHSVINPQWSAWMLERRYGYGVVQKSEVSGPDGGAIEIKDTGSMSFEERVAKVANLFETAKRRMESGEPPTDLENDSGTV